MTVFLECEYFCEYFISTTHFQYSFEKKNPNFLVNVYLFKQLNDENDEHSFTLVFFEF